MSGNKRLKLQEKDEDEAFLMVENLPKKMLPLVKDVLA